LIIVTTVAVLVLACALMVVITKTHQRRDGVTIHDLVDEDVMVRRQEALADELAAGAPAAEVEIETAGAVQRRTIPWS